MKVIIAGSRECDSYIAVCKAIVLSGFDCGDGISEVVYGGARGPDKLGKLYADIFGIPVVPFLADWNGPHKKAAGFIRNRAMADYCTPYQDGLIAVWDGRSNGTMDMVRRSKIRHLKIFVYNYVMHTRVEV